MKLRDISGQRIGELLVLVRHHNIGRRVAYLCLCKCGKEKIVRKDHLDRRLITSCGCRRSEKISKALTTHGKTDTRVYRIYKNMINRCHYVRWPEWHLYGGRGIKVCDRWRESFENFYADMGDPPSDKYSIDRINNDGGYEPGNCRWATSVQQAANRRKPVRV